MTETAATIRRRVGAKVARMTPEQARAKFDACVAAGKRHGMHNDVVRDLTGGYCSQSIDFEVRRKLAARAGLIPGP